MSILEDLDVKGTGDIEFDEFIYFMTRPQVNKNQSIVYRKQQVNLLELEKDADG